MKQDILMMGRVIVVFYPLSQLTLAVFGIEYGLWVMAGALAITIVGISVPGALGRCSLQPLHWIETVDILPALKCGDSSCETAMPGRENVASRVHVAVVMGTTRITAPFSYSKTRSTFRTAVGYRPAARTGLGGVSLIDNLENHACVSAFVFQHGLEHPPASVQARLCQPGPGYG